MTSWITEYPHRLVSGEIYLIGTDRNKMKKFIRGYYKPYYRQQIKDVFT